MGQGEVLETLEKNKTWMSVKEISNFIKVNESNIRRSLNKLTNDEVESKEKRNCVGGIKRLWKIKN